MYASTTSLALQEKYITAMYFLGESWSQRQLYCIEPSTRSMNGVPAVMFVQSNQIKVGGVNHKATVQISDRGAPRHKVHEVVRPWVEYALTPAAAGLPASLYACWIASTTQ